MVTPLLDNDHLDVEGTKRVADHMVEGGVSAIFLLGTTGESQSISMRLRYEFVETMCAHIAGRVPVLVAITETSMRDSLDLAAHAKKCGAVAVVSAPPYYFPANQKELIDWYTCLADNCPLPVFLYNMPSKVKVFLEVDSYKAAASGDTALAAEYQDRIMYLSKSLYGLDPSLSSISFLGLPGGAYYCLTYKTNAV